MHIILAINEIRLLYVAKRKLWLIWYFCQKWLKFWTQFGMRCGVCSNIKICMICESYWDMAFIGQEEENLTILTNLEWREYFSQKEAVCIEKLSKGSWMDRKFTTLCTLFWQNRMWDISEILKGSCCPSESTTSWQPEFY